ncbi:MAG: hypothetical protein LBT25_13950, partial [Candidatus Symbiothrix sp.]|nr:hypothetical protein [Candidatus Symbiothrix sp.]
EHFYDERIYEKFIANNGEITISELNIKIELKKKRDLPQILEMMNKFDTLSYPWLENKKLKFIPVASS